MAGEPTRNRVLPRNRWLRGLAALTLVAAFVAPAVLVESTAVASGSGEITLQARGTVVDVVGLGGAIGVGEPFSITYTFDPTTPDTQPLEGYGVYNAVSSVQVDIGGYSWSGPDGQIVITNDVVDSVGIQDAYQADSGPSLAGPIVNGLAPYLAFVVAGAYAVDGGPIADESLPSGPLDLSLFPNKGLAMKLKGATCTLPPLHCTQGVVQATLESWTQVSPDLDGDGVQDNVDADGGAGTSPPGAFDDHAGTTGQLTNANGLAVTISDAPSPNGVRAVVGSGVGQASFLVCGRLVQIAAGGDGLLTCGSVIVTMTVGSAQVVLGGGLAVVSVPAGVSVEVGTSLDGSFTVDVLAGSTGSATVTVDGISTTVGVDDPVATVRAWHFVGFSQPVDNGGVANTVKAGAVIPLRWRSLDALTNPVTTLASATIKVAALTCGSTVTQDQIEETSPGGSGLQNLGNGYYQLNWKTPTTYARSCKTLKLDIGDGVTHDAIVWFTK
jgi:hypothetical protein